MAFHLTTTDSISTNRHQVKLYATATDGSLTEIANIINNPPHPERTWTFTGLVSGKNYTYFWTEIDSGGADIQTYASQNFTVPTAGSTIIKAPQEIIADTTAGVTSGTTEFTMDGSGGTDDWRGWQIHLERVGFGTQFTTENYTFNSITGTVTLIGELVPFEKLYVEFTPQVFGTAVVTGNSLFSGIKLITASETLLASDFGTKNILVKGASGYIELTIPIITSIPELTPLYIESGRGSHKSIVIISATPNAIDWMEGARTRLYMGICESLVLYRTGTELRVINPYGNYKTVGEIVSEDAEPADLFNKVELNDMVLLVNDYARLYNDYILKLPSTQVVTFDQWPFFYTRFSLANGSGQFHVPDRRNLFERQTDAAGVRNPGYYQPDVVGQHNIIIDLPTTDAPPGIDQYEANRMKGGGDRGLWTGDTHKTYTINTGVENNVKNYSTRRYIRT